MKKIINGKVYDTKTATSLCFYCTNDTWRDFRHCEETLYRKKTGEFFLFGQGGAMTRYAESCGGNSWGSGSKIIPLDYDSARAWAEEHASADEYESIFGEIVEDESKEQICLSLSASAVALARRRASEQAISLSAYIESLIN